MTQDNWTPRDISVVDTLLRAGYSGNEIGARLNRSKSAVFRCAKKHDFHSLRMPNGQRGTSTLVAAEEMPEVDTFVVPAPPPPVLRLPALAMPIAHARTCQWPMWSDHERPTHRFCGAPTEARSYCLGHSRIAWGRASRPGSAFAA